MPSIELLSSNRIKTTIPRATRRGFVQVTDEKTNSDELPSWLDALFLLRGLVFLRTNTSGLCMCCWAIVEAVLCVSFLPYRHFLFYVSTSLWLCGFSTGFNLVCPLIIIGSGITLKSDLRKDSHANPKIVFILYLLSMFQIYPRSCI